MSPECRTVPANVAAIIDIAVIPAITGKKRFFALAQRLR
jgi:hypothetical protein